jgi:surface antigen
MWCKGSKAFVVLGAITVFAMSGSVVGSASSVSAKSVQAPTAPTLDLATPELGPGDHAILAVEAHGGRNCQLTFASGRTRQGPYLLALGGRSHVQWMWSVPRDARKATWHATVVCASARSGLRSHTAPRFLQTFYVAGSAHESTVVAGQHARAVAHRSSRTHLRIVRAGTMRASASAAARTEGLFAQTPVGAHGNGLGSGGVTQGGFEPDQCTGYADQRRPDIHAYAVAHGVQTGGWNGNMWGVFAARAGLPTGGTPVAGAIASFQGGRYGHVAYVESVNANGSYVVSEENYGPSEWNNSNEEPGYPDAPDPSLRTIYATPPGTVFIYGGPASNPGGSPGGSPTPPPPAVMTGSPAVVPNQPGTPNAGALSAYAIGSNGIVYTSWQPTVGSGWTAWQEVGSQGVGMTGSPAVVPNQPGTPHAGALSAYAIGSNGIVYTSWQPELDSSWTPWQEVGSQGLAMTGSPAVVANQPGTPNAGALSVYAVGSNGLVYTSWQPTVGSAWTPWQEVGSQGLAMTGSPAVVPNQPGTPHAGALSAYAVGSNGLVYTSWQPELDSTWTPWQEVGSQGLAMTGSPAVVPNQPGTPHAGALSAYAVGSNGLVYTSWQPTVGSGWTAWQEVGSQGVGMTGSPAVVPNQPGTPHAGALSAYAVGSNGIVYTSWQPTVGSGWTAWQEVGSQGLAMTGSPAVVPNQPGTPHAGALSAYAIGSNGIVYTSWQPELDSSWTPWQQFGAQPVGMN